MRLYPMVQVLWVRGREPELEVGRCSDLPPPAPSVTRGEHERREPRAFLGDGSNALPLTPFGRQELHWLLQCHGLSPRNDSSLPADVQVLPPDVACSEIKAYEELQAYRWWRAVYIFIGCSVTLLCSLKFAYPRWKLWRGRGAGFSGSWTVGAGRGRVFPPRRPRHKLEDSPAVGKAGSLEMM